MTDNQTADDPRTQLLHALDFSACLNLGYGTPEELLAAYDASRAPADRAALRQRAEAALKAVEAALGDTLVPAAREEALAGIVAVLPPTADRAAILRWAADRLAELRAAEREWLPATGLHKGEQELRRMADETPTTETPFTPPAHYRRDDGVDCCVHAIPVGPDSCPACRELADDQPAAGPTIVDQVVVALQAKAQALSVEAEEEMRRDLEEQAQVWHEAAELARRTGRKAARSAQPAAGARQDGAESTALDVLRCLADPEACRWEGVYCITHSWRSDIGRCPHGQAQALLGASRTAPSSA